MTIYTDRYGNAISGAGILIIEDYYKKNGDIVKSIVVVRNKYSGKYMDFGGTYEKKHGNLKVTAHNELREESINLYNIAPKYFKTYFDIPAGNTMFYRVFVIKLNGTSRKLYNNNKKIINNNPNVPRCWKETDDIAHIPIQNIDFDRIGNKSKFDILDIDNRKLILHGRLKKALYYGKQLLLEYMNQKPLLKYSDIVIHKSNRFTNNTYSFTKK